MDLKKSEYEAVFCDFPDGIEPVSEFIDGQPKSIVIPVNV